jgi:hypothetical protein
MGMTLAHFQLVGNIPVLRDKLKSLQRGDFEKVKLFIFVKFSWTKFMIKQYYKSIGVKKRKQESP